MALGNLASRLLVALVAGPLIALLIYIDHHAPFWGLIFVASLVAMHELFSMAIEDPIDRIVSVIFGAGAVSALYWMGGRGGELIALLAAVMPVSLYYLFRFGDIKTAGPRLTVSIAGIVYAGILFTFLALLKRDGAALVGSQDPDVGGHLVVFVLLVAWIGDTGAYFAGRFLGKTKLYPAVSPGKTWAGAIGGLAGAAAAAVGLKLGLLTNVGWVHIFAMAIPGAALGQMGDLVESMLKRSYGVKDSSNILPGHGGILDRMDAVLFIGPYIYLYLVVQPQIAALF